MNLLTPLLLFSGDAQNVRDGATIIPVSYNEFDVQVETAKSKVWFGTRVARPAHSQESR